jgi:hypothetical protein
VKSPAWIRGENLDSDCTTWIDSSMCMNMFSHYVVHLRVDKTETSLPKLKAMSLKKVSLWVGWRLRVNNWALVRVLYMGGLFDIARIYLRRGW